ncbi:two component transcriptional regulator, LytTR family [Dyadobacter soli]|uniref:Two component transcriptional regulator, LytTR family n=1 Tax=Dyadobacter soli TaxID=659014 RepID=A0A1G7MLY3_9BACT|nr:LytTR family DNA-binding domain-containing protein [Dyadobacter soli]SDF62626.1 two component transcriptional regulator, LytTR family [Dyadobacter soli]
MIDCLIVDDSPIARDIIAGFCGFSPKLRVLASLGQALLARQELERSKIDILFLDINMPVLSGIELVRTLPERPQIIFTTAYSEYAVEAFELSACDYLVKPFSLERFIKATDKAIQNIENQQGSGLSTSRFLFVKNDRATHRVDTEKILYLEANRNSTKVVTEDGTLLSSLSLSVIEKQLSAAQFVRVHRSFIISTSKVTSFQNSKAFIGKNEIPLGENYKSGFTRAIGLEKL